MADQYAYGVDGALYLGGQEMSRVNSWSMNITPGVADVTDIGSSGPVRDYTKFNDFTGSLTGQYRFVTPTTDADTAAAQENVTLQFVSGGTPAALYIKLIESSKSMYHGNVVFTNVSKGQAAEGLQTWSGDWAQSNGPLAHTTSTST